MLMISGNNEIWHTSIQSTYDAASSGDYILTLDSYSYEEDLYFDPDVSFNIQGGFGSGFHLIGVTSIYGTVTNSAGTVAFDNVLILPLLP